MYFIYLCCDPLSTCIHKQNIAKFNDSMEISDIEASIPDSTVRSIVVILNGVTVTAVVGTEVVVSSLCRNLLTKLFSGLKFQF